MSAGTYEETLPCGGKLRVTKNSWEIFYYFSGPDLRARGDIVTIPGSAVRQYAEAFRDNWLEYQSLKKSIPTGGEFSKAGKLDMTIRVGKFSEGVCLRSYHMPVNTVAKLKEVINGYIYAEKRVVHIQEFLSNLA